MAAARVLGLYGDKAEAAVPALIEAAQTREEGHTNWRVDELDILALGWIRPDARPAIPTFRDIMKERPGSYLESAAIVALYHLAPDGKEIAEAWLAKPFYPLQRNRYRMVDDEQMLNDRAMVLGAMGRTSPETDWLVRRTMERIDRALYLSHPWHQDPLEYIEHTFKSLGEFGPAARLAIPWLIGLRKHENPILRVWVEEDLERIAPPAPK